MLGVLHDLPLYCGLLISNARRILEICYSEAVLRSAGALIRRRGEFSDAGTTYLEILWPYGDPHERFKSDYCSLSRSPGSELGYQRKAMTPAAGTSGASPAATHSR